MLVVKRLIIEWFKAITSMKTPKHLSLPGPATGWTCYPLIPNPVRYGIIGESLVGQLHEDFSSLRHGLLAVRDSVRTPNVAT